MAPISSHTNATVTRRKLSTPVIAELADYRPQQVSGLTIIELSRRGVGTRQVDLLTQLLQISIKEMSPLLQIAERTLHRFRRRGYLDQPSSERFLLLENLTAHGLLVFDGQSESLSSWLRYPLKELTNQSPLTLLATISGFGLVDDVLTRIEYGVYS